jgi:hypothetical protein
VNERLFRPQGSSRTKGGRGWRQKSDKKLTFKIPARKPKADKDQKLTIRILAWKSVELSKGPECDEPESSMTSEETKDGTKASEAMRS